MSSLKDVLTKQLLLADVTLPDAIDALLTATSISSGDTQAASGTAHLDPAAFLKALGLGSIVNTDLGPDIPWSLVKGGVPGAAGSAFVLLLNVTSSVLVDQLLVKPLPGLQAAEVDASGAGGAVVGLKPLADATVRLAADTGFAIVVSANAGEAARLWLTTETDPALAKPGVLPLKLAPASVLVGDTGLGVVLGAQGMIFDFSVEQPASGAADPAAAKTSPANPSWRGIAIAGARLYLPKGVPFVGGAACDLSLSIGFDPPGIQLASRIHVPAADGRPEMDIRLECRDPLATGLASFAPTLVEVAITLPVDGTKEDLVPGTGSPSTLQLLGGKPVIARVRFARAPATGDGKTKVTVAFEAQGENGILLIAPPQNGDDRAALWAIAAADFATAIVANQKLAPGQTDQAPTGMAALMIGGAALSALLAGNGSGEADLRRKGRVKVNAVEIAAAGPGAGLTDLITLKVDYSVDVPVKPINVGTLSIGLHPMQLLRIRLRGVTLTWNGARTGLDRLQLDYRHAVMDIEDPGRWLIDGPGSLFDVIGTRSGRGSAWIEVDLRFRLDLGPLRVSGATIRATLGEDGTVSAGLRGLDVGFNLPALVNIGGGVTLGPGKGDFGARLKVGIVPLNTSASATLRVKGKMVLIDLDVDFPAPLPLGPSGLGLFGIGGTFGMRARLNQPPKPFDLLQWTPATGFTEAAGEMSFGVKASVGTLPDLSFAFGAKARLFVTVPDFAFLGALDAAFVSGPVSLDKPSDNPDAAGPKAVVQGVVSVDPKVGTMFALRGTLQVPTLLTATIPVAGNFPGGSPDWYVHVGADGFPIEGRDIGPARMTVLPDLFPQSADGYLMVRGNGITSWPRGQAGALTVQRSFVIAFGFNVSLSFGPRPLAWAEVSGGADLLIAASPRIIAGFGRLDGSLHLGPVSLGVSATLSVIDYEGSVSGTAEVCGRVRIIFVTIHRCAKLHLGDEPTIAIPNPATLPTEIAGQDASGAVAIRPDLQLVDDSYSRIAALEPAGGAVPVVWPDILIRIGCTVAPSAALDPESSAQFSGAQSPPVAKPVGSEMLRYDWRVTRVALMERQPDGSWTLVAGSLSARWQAGKSGDANAVAQAAELLLLTPDPAVWLQKLHDPAAAPGDPLGALANNCRVRPSAQPGWMLGGMAQHPVSACWVPPEFISGDPKDSRVEGAIAWALDRGPGQPPLALSGFLFTLQPGQLFSAAAVVPSAVKLGREFTSALAFPSLVTPRQQAALLAVREARFMATVTLVTPIVSGTVAFVVLGPPIPLDDAPITVADETGAWTFVSNGFASGATGTLFSFRMPPGRKARRLTIRWPFRLRIGLLGLEGVTTVAAAAAAFETAGAQAGAGQTKGAAGPPGDGNAADQRCLLKPATEYRLDVGFGWSAARFVQGENGQKTPASPPTASGTDALSGPGLRSYHFRTAAAASPPAGASQSDPAYSDSVALADLSTRQDAFDPRMLVRYLAGSEPAQGEETWFTGDAIRFHWRVGHSARLAALYDYSLAIAVQRTDTPVPDASPIPPGQTFRVAMNPAYLSPANRVLWQLAREAPCPVPVTGATQEAPVQLQPRAWYETHVRL
ncbi:MAG: hypothetical protein RQ833_09335 [Sphingomonadaceae bacterium]|nr:hypothetical protein [Sphingomonadaceae bacterium]